MERDLRIAVFGQKRLSREGGVEIVVKELCTRMAQQGCQVTCYNRSGHHVSGAEYDDIDNTNYEGIRQKSVPTIEKKGARDIIRGCHNRDKGTAENERLRTPKFIFSYPKNERLTSYRMLVLLPNEGKNIQEMMKGLDEEKVQ